MNRLVLILAGMIFFVGAPAFAQEQGSLPVRKLVKIEHANVAEAARLLTWIRHYASRELDTIILEGTAEEVAKAEEIIRAVDVQSDTSSLQDGAIEIDAYFLSAGAGASGGAIPPLITPVVGELQKRFSYAHYGLLDSALVRVAVGSGDAEVQGQFAREEGGPVSYSFSVKPTHITVRESGRSVHLGNLRAEWNIPYREQVTNFETGQTSTQTLTRTLQLQTNLAVPEGKLVVVGKAGSPTSAEAIFLVLRARLDE